MNSDYNLTPDEALVMQSENVMLIDGRNQVRLEEVALTNKNLILVSDVSTGLFSCQRMVKRCPLAAISCPEGIPQVFVGKQKDKHVLQAAFSDESISLYFDNNPKREAKRWADAIKCAFVGDIDSISTEETQLSEDVTNIIDGVTGFVGAFASETTSAAKKAFGVKQGPRKAVVSKATSKCIGCHAPLLGTKGNIATCEYCGTKQTL